MRDVIDAISQVRKAVEERYDSTIKWKGSHGESRTTEYEIKKALFSVERHCGMWMWKFKVYYRDKTKCSKHQTERWSRVPVNVYACKCGYCRYTWCYELLFS